MELIGQEKNHKDDKLKKILKISLIITVILFFVILGVMLYLSFEESKQLKLFIDKQKTTISQNLFQFDQNSGKIYVSVQDIAKSVGYDYYNGDFKKLTEDQDKCYVNNKKEVAGIQAGSNKMYKADPTLTEQNYEWYTLDEPVRILNGRLYVSSSTIEKMCNLKFNYNEAKNRIEIQTLPYLVSGYEALVINSYGYAGLDTEYKNQKAILYDMLVIRRQEDKNIFKYGVISFDNKQIIGPKYNKIEYIEVANDFLVTTEASKVGIVSSLGAQKIEPSYDEIKVLDNDLRLYLVQNNNLYGVLDKNGRRIVYIEYEKIGIDASLFKNDEIVNNMLLFENCIPVMKNTRWGLYDKNGNVLAENVFDSLGYINGTRKDTAANNLLLIPPIEGIVVYQNGKYGILSSTGKKFIAPCGFDRIYSITNLGENKYYLEVNGQTYSLDEYLKITSQTSEYKNTSQENKINENKTTNTIDNQIANTINSQATNSISTEQTNTNNTTTTQVEQNATQQTQTTPGQQVQPQQAQTVVEQPSVPNIPSVVVQ